jgi:hypothetical protein
VNARRLLRYRSWRMNQTLYRRPLPTDATEFSSTAGRQLLQRRSRPAVSTATSALPNNSYAGRAGVLTEAEHDEALAAEVASLRDQIGALWTML